MGPLTGGCSDFWSVCRRRLQYYRQYLPPGGAAAPPALYGVYAPTEHDHQKEFYTALVHGALPPGPAPPPPAPAAPGAAAALSPREEALLGGDIHVAAWELLGMHLFLGGISHAEYRAWRAQQGLLPADAAGLEL